MPKGAHDLNFDDMPPRSASSCRSCSATSAKASSGKSSALRAATTTRRRENKGYNERLRMPQFKFDGEQREQVITFVLGLVAEPPASSTSTRRSRGAPRSPRA